MANITETCDPENELQLITKVSVESNTTDDQDLFVQDIKELKEETEIEEVWTDGGYVGEKAHEAAEENEVEHNMTAIKGRSKEEGKIGLEDFTIKQSEDGKVVEVICPGGESGEIKHGNKPGRYTAGFNAKKCAQCPFRNQCPVKKLKKKEICVLRFSQGNVRTALQRQKIKEQGSKGNIRAAVESTIRSIIHPFGGHLCKMPVRGKIRIKTMILLSAAMINVRRIANYSIKVGRNWLFNSLLKPIFVNFSMCMNYIRRIVYRLYELIVFPKIFSWF